jgi:transposase, IS5 family
VQLVEADDIEETRNCSTKRERKLVKLAKRLGVVLRQSYAWARRDRTHRTSALRSCPPVQGANRSLRKLKTCLSRVIRHIKRKIVDDDYLKTRFAWLLNPAGRVRDQRGPKVYSLHAPEVECIGKGKPHRPYEFGVKASAAGSTLKRSKGGQFAIHAQAPGNPYDGHMPHARSRDTDHLL